MGAWRGAGNNPSIGPNYNAQSHRGGHTPHGGGGPPYNSFPRPMSPPQERLQFFRNSVVRTVYFFLFEISLIEGAGSHFHVQGSRILVHTRITRHEGVLAPFEQERGGIVLTDVKDLNNPSSAPQESLFLPFPQIIAQELTPQAPNGNNFDCKRRCVHITLIATET